MIDARYEDADETPLRLTAADAEDLTVISALVQDAVFPVTEMRWQPALRRFALLLNRFRWEDQAGVTGRHPPERTQAVLVIQDALHVASSGFDRREGDLVLSLLSVEFEAGADGTWSDGLSPARTSLSIRTSASRSAACGVSSTWSMRMPSSRLQAPA